MSLQGIPDIRKVFIREAKRILPSADAPDGYSNDSEWMLDTEGVNLLQVPAVPPLPAAPCALQPMFCVLHCSSLGEQHRSAVQGPWVGIIACRAWREGLQPAHSLVHRTTTRKPWTSVWAAE